MSKADADPVSWFVVERGWKVVCSDGTEIGKVERTIGDSTHDIFDGIAVSGGLLQKTRYVPSECVGRITEGVVELTIPAEEADRLEDFEEPPPAEQIIVGDELSLWQRLARWLRGGRPPRSGR